jgi:hypothetical protein
MVRTLDDAWTTVLFLAQPCYLFLCAARRSNLPPGPRRATASSTSSDQSETLQVRELSGSDPLVWKYRPEIELVSFGNFDPRANYIIVSGKPPVGGLVGVLTTDEVYDDANGHLVGLERLLHHADLTNLHTMGWGKLTCSDARVGVRPRFRPSRPGGGAQRQHYGDVLAAAQ